MQKYIRDYYEKVKPIPFPYTQEWDKGLTVPMWQVTTDSWTTCKISDGSAVTVSNGTLNGVTTDGYVGGTVTINSGEVPKNFAPLGNTCGNSSK